MDLHTSAIVSWLLARLDEVEQEGSRGVVGEEREVGDLKDRSCLGFTYSVVDAFL